MTSFKTFASCMLLFSLGIPSKALDETHWPNDGFLRDEEQHVIQRRAISDAEISATAMLIWNSVKDLNVQYDGQKQKKEPLRLFTKDQRALKLDRAFTGLFDFYNARTGEVDPCVRTSDCKRAQTRFIETISQNKGPIWILHEFLRGKDLFKGNYKAFKDHLQQMWFTSYNRTPVKVDDTSAFEHVFLGEIVTFHREDQVEGLHNWMRMYDEELDGRFVLNEEAKYFPMDKPAVADVKFNWTGYTKKQGTTFFMKKSPAVEIALYTLCFKVRPGKPCSINFGTGAVNVIAKPVRGKKDIIFTAFPEFP